jgi:hypothetical protein
MSVDGYYWLVRKLDVSLVDFQKEAGQEAVFLR